MHTKFHIKKVFVFVHELLLCFKHFELEMLQHTKELPVPFMTLSLEA
jgi:hypothetical protein